MKNFTLTLFVLLAGFGMRAQLVDPGFEGGTDASGWTQESTNFGTPLCTAAACGTCGGPCGSQAGDWYAWFGGAGPDNEEVAALTQVVSIPAGTAASLSVYTKVATPGDALETERVDLFIDNTVLATVTAAQATQYADYTQLTFDISSFAGGTHTIGLIGYSMQGTNILFDSFDLTVDGSSTVGINELLNREEAVTFFPNPASDKLNVRFNSFMEGSATVSIFDMNGKLVNSETWSNVFNGTYSFNTLTLENGLYNVQIQNGTNTYTERVVVSH